MTKKKIQKIVAVFLAINLLTEIIYPTAAFALTTGPSQPEVQNFTPVSTSEMVDVSSGNYNYNIPLLDIGGYPINLSYTSGISMDQEASWVGLGWNINPGVIARSMRALPDDFNGDEIRKEFNVKPNTTYGITASPDAELFGAKLSKFIKRTELGVGLSYNNYSGYAFSIQMNPTIASGQGNKTSYNLGLGLSASTNGGFDVKPTLSFSKKTGEDTEGRDKFISGKIGVPFNSRGGLQALTISGSIDKTVKTDGEKLVKGGGDLDKDGKPAKVGSVKNGGSAISFASPSYTPSVGRPMLNVSLSLSATIGGEAVGAHPGGRVKGFFSGQYLTPKGHDQNLPAYGYMNTQNGAQLDRAMLDFNREKDGGYTPTTPALPLTNYTYDVYSVSGQGIGGMYRPYRSDIGILHDSRVTNWSSGIDFGGIEIGVGAGAHPGVNVSVNVSNTTSGMWEDDNNLLNRLSFKGASSGDDLYEPYYFKQAGEKTADSDPSFLAKSGGLSAVRVNLDAFPLNILVEAGKSGEELIGNSNVTTAINPGENVRTKRQSRNESIVPLSAKDAKEYGDIQKIESYQENTFTVNTTSTDDYYKRYKPDATILRDDNHRKAYHISQITSYRADGARYVYGIAAYNEKQQDVTFAIDHPTCSSGSGLDPWTKGLVPYISGTDDSRDNNRGLDHYFDRTTMPGYAHSYLLTEILSADYVDVNDNGPDDKDLGNYTKINYTKVSGGSEKDPYRWRVPYQHANYNEGLYSDNLDDKASYIYGEKEVWYIHSIETKNYVADFTLSQREDALGVAGEAGGLATASTDKSRKIDRIDLYSRQDKINNPSTAVPIKTVHFQYDYSLCQGVPNNTGTDATDIYKDPVTNTTGNNDGGKLTLRKVYFTYGNSQKSRLSPYIFTYADFDHSGTQDVNYAYNLKGYDRWGHYNNINNSGTGTALADIDVGVNSTITCDDFNGTSDGLVTAEFPYVRQDLTTNTKGSGFYSYADYYAAAWSLTDIELPSGGTIKVDYEADDYAYVQDKQAMQMFTVEGMGTSSSSVGSDLYTSSYDPCNYIKIKLPISTSDAAYLGTLIKDKQGKLIANIYFKFLVNLEKSSVPVGSPPPPKYEYITGYAQLTGGTYNTDYGFFGSTPSQYAWIKVQTPQIQDKIKFSPTTVNPIAQAAWNFTKLYRGQIAYSQPGPGVGVLNILKSIVSVFKQVVNTFEGFCNSLRIDNASREFVPGKSIVRLNNPDGFKKGGGLRVRRVALADNWPTMTGVSGADGYIAAEYGQNYDYTTKDEYGTAISSGVASYEPAMGNEENPFRQPVAYKTEHFLAADDLYYQETPYGESFFPGAAVVYSKVSVTNYFNNDQPVTRNNTGKVVHEFYTAKDFPTIVSLTSIDPKRFHPSIIMKLLKLGDKDYMTASQGYSIRLNDMPGKPKSQMVFAQNDDKQPISGVQYNYRQGTELVDVAPFSNTQVKKTVLENSVNGMYKNGTVEKTTIGVDYDFVVDMRQHESQTYNVEAQGNLDAFLAGPVPIIAPILMTFLAREHVRFRSAVATKVINQYGILEETVAFDLGSRVSTRNKLYDAETGEVLLTETVNQFDDPVFAFTYPAHWKYDRMGQVYKNIGFSTSSSSATRFVVGDELALLNSTGDPLSTPKVWVTSINPINVVDKTGANKNTEMAGAAIIKVLRSGRRNQQNTPIGSFTSLVDPLVYNTDGYGIGLKSFDEKLNIINANVVEFTENTGVFCECGLSANDVVNPFLKGRLGNFRPLRSRLQLTGRSQTRFNDNTNVRRDGIFSWFYPFWILDVAAAAAEKYNAKDWIISSDSPKWQFTSQVTTYSPFGFELENQDALLRYSAAVYGYNNSLPIAVASNSRYREVAFDSFEDYGFDDCTANHFSFRAAEDVNVVSTKSHAGRRSVELLSGETLVVKKQVDKCGTAPSACTIEMSSISGSICKFCATEACPYYTNRFVFTSSSITGSTATPFTYHWVVVAPTAPYTVIGTSTSTDFVVETVTGGLSVKLTVIDADGCSVAGTATISNASPDLCGEP